MKLVSRRLSNYGILRGFTMVCVACLLMAIQKRHCRMPLKTFLTIQTNCLSETESDTPTPNYAGEHLLKLYKRVLGSKSQAAVSYLTWDNMNRFFRTAAKKLSSTIAAYLQSSAEQ